MSHSQKIRNGLMGVAAGGWRSAARRLGGAATNSGATSQQSALGPRPDPRTPGGHIGTNGKTEMALSGKCGVRGGDTNVIRPDPRGLRSRHLGA